MKKLILLVPFVLLKTCVFSQLMAPIDSSKIVDEEDLISPLYTEAIISILSDDYFRGRDIRDKRIRDVKNYLISVMKNNEFVPVLDSSFLLSFDINESLKSESIVSIYRGDPTTKNSILFTANYDNIGVFQINSFSDSIYNGANDNASGITALIQSALYLKNKGIKKNIIIALTSGRRYGYSGHSIITDEIFKKNYRIEYAFRFLRLAKPVTESSTSVFIKGSKNSKLLANKTNSYLGEKFLLPINELNSMKEFEQPFHRLIENLTGAECYTFTTFNYVNDPEFFTPKDDFNHLNVDYFHSLIVKLSKGLYQALK